MNTRTCPSCTNGRVKHYRSGYSPEVRRCGACKGTGRVSAAGWLRAYCAMPRPALTRPEAIRLSCYALGLRPDGTADYSANGCEILANGVGGLVADLRVQGFADVADRLKTAYLAQRTCETAEGFEAFVAQVVEARAEIGTKLAA